MLTRPWTPIGLGWIIAVIVVIVAALVVLGVIPGSLHVAFILILALGLALLL